MADSIRKPYLLVTLLVLMLVVESAFSAADNGKGNGNGKDNSNGVGNNGAHNGNANNGNGKDNSNGVGNNGQHNGNKKGSDHDDEGKGKGKGKGGDDDDDKDFEDMPDDDKSGMEKHKCKGKSKCKNKFLVCPPECPSKKPKKNKKNKACYVDCNRNCEVVCKYRKPNCNGYGSLCYDPRFVGGDGVMFYFHGARGGNFAILSDDNVQINAHFIGTRPEGRTRDYTWVQALGVMFESHKLVIAAKRLSSWDDAVDALTVRWNGEAIDIPRESNAEWRINSGERSVVVERTDDVNNVRIRVSGLTEMNIRVRQIGKEEDKVHNYQIPDGDVFAHLETQFKFDDLSEQVEGVLGKTYRPDYVSPAKVGVPMPVLGGEDKYQTASLLSALCPVCKFSQGGGVAAA